MRLMICLFLSLIIFTVPTLAQVDHHGGGDSTEADLKNYINEIDHFLQTPGGKKVFPEIVSYDQKNGANAFHLLVSAVNPVVKDEVVRDDFGVARTCVSHYGKGVNPSFICNSKLLPDQSVTNQRSLYRIVFHELLVQAEIEKPISKDIPSEYNISSRITSSLTLVGGIRWFLIVPEFFDGMPSPLMLDFASMTGINSADVTQKLTNAAKTFLDLLQYDFISIGQALTPVVGDPNHQFYFQFVSKSRPTHLGEAEMTMPCFAIINAEFDVKSMKGQCSWTGAITALAQKLANDVSFFNRLITKDLQGDTFILGGNVEHRCNGVKSIVDYTRIKAKVSSKDSVNWLGGVDENLNDHPEYKTVISSCLLRQARELEKLNHNGYERLIKAIHVEDIVIDESNREPQKSGIIDSTWSMMNNWTWGRGTKDEKSITLENGLVLKMEMRINLRQKDPCSVITFEELTEYQSGRGISIRDPVSRIY